MGKIVKFGVIGCGLMGREFAGAAARWCHLLDSSIPRPEIAAVCDVNEQNREWFVQNVHTVRANYSDYKDLLANPDIDAVYCAVPHHLHEQIYIDIIESGKSLMGEKPFGIDEAANKSILAALKRSPKVFARCASEFPYFPAMQVMVRWIKEGKFGKILKIHAGFNHSSDIDPEKPINWKRQVKYNGEYGCLGDLGIHTQHVPFRLGFIPEQVFASLQNHIPHRLNVSGETVDCDTWDNAMLLCDAASESGSFPMILEANRMSPGDTNNWFFEIYGLDNSAKFTTSKPDVFTFTQSWGKEQAWADINIGYKPLFPTVTGPIFEFGFTDAILQMWAAFMAELDGREVAFGCFSPAETALSHRLSTAALLSEKTGRKEPLSPIS